MEKQTFRLDSKEKVRLAFVEAFRRATELVLLGKVIVLEIRGETRNDRQNRLLHAALGDIAKQLEWAGKKRDIDTWKRLCMAAWLRARGESVEILPAIDGHGVDIVFTRTSKLTKAECAEFCEFIFAWGVDNGVTFHDTITN